MRWLFFVAVLSVAIPAQAGFLDRDREGFFITLGVGASYTTHIQEFRVNLPDSSVEVRSERGNTWGPVAVLRVGGGLGDQVQIYYTLRTVWFEEPTNGGSKEEIITSAHSGLGITLFRNLTSPTLYYFGSVGFSHWWAPFADNSPLWTGFGIVGGVGYEFFQRVAIEASASYGSPQDELNRVRTWSFGTSLNLTLF